MALWTGIKEIKEIQESWYFPLLFFFFFLFFLLKSYAGGLIVQTHMHVSGSHLSNPSHFNGTAVQVTHMHALAW